MISPLLQPACTMEVMAEQVDKNSSSSNLKLSDGMLDVHVCEDRVEMYVKVNPRIIGRFQLNTDSL